MKPAAESPGMHRIFVRGQGRKCVIADSAFKRVQVDPRARWLDADEHHLGLAPRTGRALKWSRWNDGGRSSRLGHGASLQTGGSTTLSVTGNICGWTVITRVCAAGNSNASQFAFGVPAKAAAVVGIEGLV